MSKSNWFLNGIWRFGLLFLILVCLLTCYQLIGDDIRNFLVVAQAPLLRLRTLGRENAPASDRQLIQIGLDRVDIEALGPPGTEVILLVNRQEVGRRVFTGAPVTFSSVALRQGFNYVQGVLFRNTGFDDPIESRMLTIQATYREYPVIAQSYGSISGVGVPIVVFGTPASLGLTLESGKQPPINWNESAVGMVEMTVTPAQGKPAIVSASDFKTSVRRWQVDADGALKPVPDPKVTAHAQITEPHPDEPLRSQTFERSVLIDLKQDRSFSIEGTLTLPADSAVAEFIRDQTVSPSEIFNEVFGLGLDAWFRGEGITREEWEKRAPFQEWHASLRNNYVESALPSELSWDGQHAILRVSGKLPSGGLKIDWDGASDWPEELRIRTANKALVKALVAAKWNQNELTIQAQRPDPAALVILGEDTAPHSASLEDPNSPRRSTHLIDYLRSWQGLIPEFWQTLLQAGVGALPFLLLLNIVRGSTLPRSRVRVMSGVCLVFLVLHLTISNLNLLGVSLRWLDLPSLLKQPALRYRFETIGSYYPFLAIGVVLLLGPLYKAYWRPRPQSTWRSVLRSVFLALTVPLVVSAILIPQFRSFGIMHSLNQPPVEFIQALIVGAALLWLPLWLAIVQLLRVNIPGWTVFLASLAMLCLPATPHVIDFADRWVAGMYQSAFDVYPVFIPWDASGLLWRWIVALLGAFLLLEITGLAIRMSQFPPALRFIRGRKRLVLIVPFMLMAVPAWYASNGLRQPGRVPELFDFSQFAHQVDRLLPFLILPGLLAVMHFTNRKNSYHLHPAAIACGSLVFAYYLCGQTATLFYVPIPLLLGWALFRKFLLRRNPDLVHPMAPSVVESYVELQRINASANERRKTLEKKFEQAKSTVADFRKGIQDVKRFLRRSNVEFKSKARTNNAQVFNLGPRPDPWSNALASLRAGLLLSIPLQISTLLRITQAPLGGFPLIDFTVGVVQSVCLWGLIAFLFGYFYHAIRGSNGFEKATAFWIALVLPTIPLRLILQGHALDSAHLIEAVQLAAFLLILAPLAFDVQVLKSAGLTWRDLPTAYGMTKSAVYVSSLALSLVSTFTTKELATLIREGVAQVIGVGSK
jgi:hypothetical protein